MSSDFGRVGDLEIREDHDFQRCTWKLQRYLWAGMAALLGLALLGLFGSGPLSHATAGPEGGPFHLKYERFAGFRSPTTLEIHLGPAKAPRPRSSSCWAKPIWTRVQIERIEPEPERVLAGPDGSTFVFLRKDSERPTRVRIHLKPERRGLISGQLRLEDGPSLGFRQLIYP